MKLNTLMIVFTIIFVVGLCLPIAADCQSTDIPKGSTAYETKIDGLIARCEKKAGMMNSKGDNIRKDAAIALMKANFFRKNKDLLVQGMIKSKVIAKSHKIEYFLNDKFFAIIRDHDKNVAQAYSKPDEIRTPAP
ncbi:hypothetical protein QUF76_10410 [Desulfobacterales bacterium HSG16]|nr:hypothetical protein [Desulfobacterales bacterium HSG16]